MVKRLSFMVVLALLASALASPVAAARPDAVGAPTDIYIVVLADAPVVAYEGGIAGLPATQPAKGTKVDPNNNNVKKYVAHLDRQHRDLLASVGAGADAIVYDYHFSLNGVAAVLTSAQAAKLSTNPAVQSLQLDQLKHVTTDTSPTFLGLNAPGGLWSDLGGQGMAGEDVIVGVIDTGIWPEHPSFSDQLDLSDPEGASGKRNLAYGPPPAGWHGTCQSGEQWSHRDCNNKLIGARYFMAGMGRHGVGMTEYKSARDADGHGTHTASTAAGNAGVQAAIFGRPFGTISGIAPRSRVAAYKACWDVGCFTTDLTAAIDAAVADGVDVINYSIGSDTPSISLAAGSDDIAFLNAASVGVFVANSAGNAGPGDDTVGSPAVTPWLTTVGASTHDRTFEATATLGNGASVTGASVTEGVGTSPLIDAGAAAAPGVDAEDAELCLPGSLDPAAVGGKIVLCLRGTNARVEKSHVVGAAGGVGMILYNPNDVMALVTDNHWVPSVHISFTDGLVVKAYAATAGATASISPGVAVPTQGSVMADFSSRGENLAAEDIIKPDVTAPGVNILAGNTPTPFDSRPGQLFQSISGTSMSSPHVAGLAALLKDLHPDWDAEFIKSALMTTARQDVVKEDGVTPATPFDMGAGHVVPNSAGDPGLVYDTNRRGYLGFLCGLGLLNPTGPTCSAVGVVDPSDLNLASIGIGSLIGSQTVTRTVTSVAAGTTTWHASIEGLAGYTVTLPADFTVDPATSHTFDVTFTRTDAPLDEWVFGALVLSSGEYSVRSPIALRARILDAPATVEETAAADSGSLSWDVQVGYTGTLSATANGLVPDAVTAGLEVAQDPDQDIETDTFTSGVHVKEFATAGVEYFAGGTLEATTEVGSDLDVFLFREHEDGVDGFTFDDLVAFSADGDSEEIVELVHPADDTYRLVVHGWGTPDGASSFDLHEWLVDDAAPDDAAFEAHAKDADPAAVATGEVVPITATFSGVSQVGTQYRGIVDYDDGTAAIGSTVVILNR